MLPFRSRIQKPGLVESKAVEDHSKDKDARIDALTKNVETIAEAIKMISTGWSQQSQVSNKLDFSYPTVEERFREVRFQVPAAPAGERQIKEWITEMCSACLSQGFYYFEHGMSEGKVRAFCGENIMANMIELAVQLKLGKQELHMIDHHLKEKVLPYILVKYPQSEMSEVNLKLSRMIKPVDEFGANRYDFIHRSGIKFAWSEDGQYNASIMQFLNYLIEAPQTPCGGVALFAVFENWMEKLFELTENEQWMMETRGGSLQHSESDKARAFEKEHKYAEKVREYTKYLIGRKISENTSCFSEREIEDSVMEISAGGLMRIITKWCEDLEELFEEDRIGQKEEMFRMRDGSERYLEEKEKDELAKQLRLQKTQINKYLQEIRDNFMFNQAMAISKDYGELPCSPREKATFSVACIVDKCNHNFTINYLNKLIHCVLSAEEGWAKALSHPPHRTNFIPSLIKFTIGDLLRSKCSSKESEITALYRHLQHLSDTSPEQVEIIRVKNRLNTGTKDILINLMFKQKIIVELQLAINSDQSNFIKCSEKFNHFLYELIRAKFGCVPELCAIMKKCDPRLAYIDKQIESAAKWKPCANKPVHLPSCGHSEPTPYHFPFECSQCSSFVSRRSDGVTHVHCQHCSIWICSRCRIVNEEVEEVNQLRQDMRIGPSLFSDRGYILDLRKRDVMLVEGHRYRIKGKSYVFEKDPSGSLYLRDVSNLRQVLAFEKDKFFCASHTAPIAKISPEIFEEIIQSEKISDCIRNNKKSLAIANRKLAVQIFQDKELPSISTLSLVKTQLSQVEQICRSFPNLNVAVLKRNLLTNFSGLQQWSALKELNLEENKLEEIPAQLSSLSTLEILNLDNNWLTELPDTICEIASLRKLYLSFNRIDSISPKIGALKKLEVLWLRKNRVEVLPEELGELGELSTLVIHENEIKELPPSMAQLRKMQMFSFNVNRIEALPDGLFEEWTQLEDIWAYENNLKSIPPSLAKCPKLKKLMLHGNQIEDFPLELLELPGFSELNASDIRDPKIQDYEFQRECGLKDFRIANSGLTHIPPFVLSLKKLVILTISDNPIAEIEPKISNLQLLQELWIHSLNLRALPAEMASLRKLKVLIAHGNQLEDLPPEFSKLKSMENLDLNDNKIREVPQCIFSMANLKELRICNNLLEEIPEEVGRLANLRLLSIKQSGHLKIPPSLLKCKKLSSLSLNSKSLDEPGQALYKQLNLS